MIYPTAVKIVGAKLAASFGCASIAAMSIQVADVQTAIPGGVFEGGAWGALVASLMYAVVTLWRSNQAIQRELRLNREKEIKEGQEREATANRTNQELLTAIREMNQKH